ncbi:hypothetical protein A6R68_06907, partial [Neotoma lepida]
MGLPRTSFLYPLVLPRLWARAEREAHWLGLLYYTPKMSIFNLTCYLKKAAKYNDIRKVKKAWEDPLKGILGYSEDHCLLQL